MKLRLLYLARNLTRNPLRSGLTCAAVALPIIIFVLSAGVIDGIEHFLDNSSRQLRLAVTQKASISNPLPSGLRPKMESLDPTRQGLRSVCGMRWLGGKIENDQRVLSTVAVDADTFPATFPEHLQSAEELAAWQRDRQAIVVGRNAASQFGWKVGDRITIRPSVPPYAPIEFHIVSTAPNPDADPLTLLCRLDYVEEEVKKFGVPVDIVHFFFVKCGSKADLEHYRAAIDKFFANSPDETLTQDEKAFMNQFITQQFNLPRNLSILAAVTVFVAVMAAMNTMSMSFRDRLSEFATLKAMGFGGGVVFLMVQFESLLLCGTGGLAGALAPYVAFTYTPLAHITVPVIQALNIRPLVCFQAVGISLLVGLVAALWPSWAAARMRVVDAFRALE
ncbi:MAG TPA: ABC transporter permease [Phycisphaerae bacterium]|nr:ABC transporter permease [Phycisphaerae bacterium]